MKYNAHMKHNSLAALLKPTGWTHSRRMHHIMGTQGEFQTILLGFCKAVQLDDAALNSEI